jgi:twitching motility two-component system response regulator PilH
MRFSAFILLMACVVASCGALDMTQGTDVESTRRDQSSDTSQLTDTKKIKGNRIKRVLVVDDSPAELQYMSEMLTKRGFVVSSAADSAQTMNVLKETSVDALPNLILIDAVLPGLNGFQLTRALTRDERYAHIPIIIVSSTNQEADRVWSARQGASDFVAKPVKADDLFEKIRAFGE